MRPLGSLGGPGRPWEGSGRPLPGKMKTRKWAGDGPGGPGSRNPATARGAQRARGASKEPLKTTTSMLNVQGLGSYFRGYTAPITSTRSQPGLPPSTGRLYPPSLSLSPRSDGRPRCVRLQRACTWSWSAALSPV